MLVLSRKKQERILIGDDVIITIVEFHGKTVRIGIDAPKNIKIVREKIASQEIASQEIVS